MDSQEADEVSRLNLAAGEPFHPGLSVLGVHRAPARAFWAFTLGAGLSFPCLLAGVPPAWSEVRGVEGTRSLGTVVNGVRDGSCGSGLCAVSGGTSAGSNLFHRFGAFDTRGGITGVHIESGGHRNVMVGVIHSLGSYIDQPVSLSSPGNLFWLSPGGITLSGAGGFQNVQHLQLSTATGLRLGSGVFDVFGTTADQATLLSGEPVRGSAGLVSDPATLSALALERNGDITLSGGLLTVEESLLLDAQGGHVVLQAAQVLLPGGQVEIAGREVSLENSQVDVSSSAGAGGSVQMDGETLSLAGSRIDASGAAGGGEVSLAATGTVGLQGGEVAARGTVPPSDSEPNLLQQGTATESSSASAAAESMPEEVSIGRGGQVEIMGASVVQAGLIDAAGIQGGEVKVVASSHLISSAPVLVEGVAGSGGSITLQAGGNVVQSVQSELKASGSSGGGTISVTAQGNLFSPGRYEVLGTGEPALGGLVEVSAPSVTLQGAYLDASGKAGGGTLHVGGGFQGETLTSGAANALITTITSSTSLKADATGRGDGGEVVVWSEEVTTFSGQVSARGGELGGDGGLLEVSGKELLQFSGEADAASPLGKPGTLLLDPKNIIIDSAVSSEQVGYKVIDLADPNPQANDFFGQSVLVLPNGNIVALDPLDDLDPLTAFNTGGAYLFDGTTGQLLSILLGGSTGDSIGSGGAISLGDNGNYLVLSPSWGAGDIQDAGAVTWVNGSTGALADGSTGVFLSSVNSLVGSTAGDGLGSSTTTYGYEALIVLSSGNYVIASDSWDSIDVGPDVGAVTWGDGSKGIAGVINSDNSLIGANVNDRVGSDGIRQLSNGNYVISSTDWNLSTTISGAGAVTWADGAIGVTGVVSSANSLIGGTAFDFVGFNYSEESGNGIITLDNGNFLVLSPSWDGSAANVGAATWVDGSSGRTLDGSFGGFVNSANSLTGGSANDALGSGGAIRLENGNVVVVSPFLDASIEDGGAVDVGSVTWIDAAVGLVGTASKANSLVGFLDGDRVGSSGVTPLTQGNYVVRSPDWDDPDTLAKDAGAVTWGDGKTGVVGVVSSLNSLVGSTDNDAIGFYDITALSNGNYVVVSSDWDDPIALAVNAGAVTWGDGTKGVNGVISTANSLIGTAGDRIGAWGIGTFNFSYAVTELTNGNYVVISSEWSGDGSGIPSYGAVTWVNGFTGQLSSGGLGGVLSSTNSLVGSTPNDWLGNQGVVALESGNYVVVSPNWDLNSFTSNVGAVTWGDGATGLTTGIVGTLNSLIGSSSSDQVGSGGVLALSSGGYVVVSPEWDLNSFTSSVGAVTWGDGSVGVKGVVDSLNSLIGSTSNDRVGSGGVVSLGAGNYVVVSPEWDLNSFSSDVGAVTWSNGLVGIQGAVSTSNSLTGSTAGDQVGSGSVQALPGGNAVVSSPFWDNGSLLNVGASTWINGSTGITGFLDETNSLVGQTAGDLVGSNPVTILQSGNYLVSTLAWSNPALGTSGSGAGAVTWVDASRGLTGKVSSANSLVGDQEFGFYGGACPEGCESIVTPLNGDQFLLGSSEYDVSGVVDSGLLQLISANDYSYSASPGADMLLTPAQIETIANRGTAVVLQASNDITLEIASPIVIDNPNGVGGSLSLEAGRSITLNSSITTDGADLLLYANQQAADPTYRDPGAAVITMAPGVSLNAGSGALLIQLSSADAGAGAAGEVSLGAITAGRIVIDAAAGLTLNGVLEALNPNAGDSIEVNSGVGAFVSQQGADGLIVNGSASWKIYSSSPGLDSINGLLPSFIQYDFAYGDDKVVLGSGNGFFYSVAPLVSVDLVGLTTRVYDATTQITLNSTNLSLSGVLGGDLVSLSPSTVVGTLDTKDVGSSKPVTVAGLGIASVTSNEALGFVPVYGYQLASSTASGAIGEVTPAALSVSLLDQSKVYDGSTTALLGSGDYQISGLVSGEGVTISQTVGVYDSKDVASASQVSAVLTGVDYVASAGTDLGNYSLDLLAEGNGQITLRPQSNWLGSEGGLWSDASLWDAYPTTGNVASVFIPADSGVVIYDFSAGATTLDSLRLDGDLRVEGGTLGLLSSATVGLGGSLAVLPGGSFSSDQLISQGDVALQGSLSVNSLSLLSGQILAPDGLSLASLSVANGLLLGGGSLLVTDFFGLSGGEIRDFSRMEITQLQGDLQLENGVLRSLGGTVSLEAPAGAIRLSNALLDTSGAAVGGTILLNGRSLLLTDSSLNTSGEADGGTIALGDGSPLPDSVTILRSQLVADPPALGGSIFIDGRAIDIQDSLLNVFGSSGGQIRIGSALTNTLVLGSGTLLQVGPSGTVSLTASSPNAISDASLREVLGLPPSPTPSPAPASPYPLSPILPSPSPSPSPNPSQAGAFSTLVDVLQVLSSRADQPPLLITAAAEDSSGDAAGSAPAPLGIGDAELAAQTPIDISLETSSFLLVGDLAPSGSVLLEGVDFLATDPFGSENFLASSTLDLELLEQNGLEPLVFDLETATLDAQGDLFVDLVAQDPIFGLVGDLAPSGTVLLEGANLLASGLFGSVEFLASPTLDPELLEQNGLAPVFFDLETATLDQRGDLVVQLLTQDTIFGTAELTQEPRLVEESVQASLQGDLLQEEVLRGDILRSEIPGVMDVAGIVALDARLLSSAAVDSGLLLALGTVPVLETQKEFLEAEQRAMTDTAQALGLGQGERGRVLSTEELQEVLQGIQRATNYSPYRPAVLRMTFSRDGSRGEGILDLALVPAQGEVVGRRVVIDGARFGEQLRNLYSQLARQEPMRAAEADAPARQLYDVLVRPLEQEIASLGITTLLLSADPGLQAVPFAALHDGRTYLAERIGIALTPSIGLMPLDVPPAGTRTQLRAGASRFEGLAPLPLVPQELNRLDLRPGRAYLDAAFTPSLLMEKAGDPAFQQVHVATHAEFLPGGPAKAKLYSGTGPMSLAEFAQLRQRRDGQPLDLFTLSACRTALGDKDSELGFAGLALQAGSRSAIGTLWYVDDVATSAFFVQFYRYLDAGLPKAEALQATRRTTPLAKVRLEGDRLLGAEGQELLGGLDPAQQRRVAAGVTHPYFWGGMQLLGTPW
jgi:CHAT domain-containing protein